VRRNLFGYPPVLGAVAYEHHSRGFGGSRHCTQPRDLLSAPWCREAPSEREPLAPYLSHAADPGSASSPPGPGALGPASARRDGHIPRKSKLATPLLATLSPLSGLLSSLSSYPTCPGRPPTIEESLSPRLPVCYTDECWSRS
jgi:hypothetical protein